MRDPEGRNAPAAETLLASAAGAPGSISVIEPDATNAQKVPA